MNTICIKEIQLKNFRCFTSTTFSLDAPIVVVEGSNGSGKTSLLEAIHYLCYIRSFRTHIPHDLVHFTNDTFFIAAHIGDDVVTVGATGAKKHIKINQKAVTSYKELRAICKVVTVTQDDNDIIAGSPEKRRTFLDHALLLVDDSIASTIKTFRHVLETRNAFLQRPGSNEEFIIWTQKLWQLSCAIQEARKKYLSDLVAQAQVIEGYFLEAHTFSMKYHSKHLAPEQSFEEFAAQNSRLFEKERLFKRSLFGAHLDDIEILFNNKPARLFSSRGQQKLLALFLKIAQVFNLTQAHGPCIFLIDDFLADFDFFTMKRIIKTCLAAQSQIVFTTPLSSSPLEIILNENQGTFRKISI